MPSDNRLIGWGLDPSTRIQLRLERTREALRRRAYELAATEAEELLDLQPDHVDGLWMLAEATMELGDYVTAQQAYQSLVRHGQGRPAVLLGLALASFECADLEACERAARRVAESDPDFGAAHYFIGLCVQRSATLAEAMPHFELAHRMGPLDFQVPVEVGASDMQLVLAHTFEALPPDLQAFWRAVQIRIEPFPGVKELASAVPPLSPRVPALADGDPATSDNPTLLRVFSGNLAHLDGVEAMVDHLVQTLAHLASDWLDPENEEDAPES
jgi:tetratricopeptide (TPR) repeat protein